MLKSEQNFQHNQVFFETTVETKEIEPTNELHHGKQHHSSTTMFATYNIIPQIDKVTSTKVHNQN
jgi:hypothetical protein